MQAIIENSMEMDGSFANERYVFLNLRIWNELVCEKAKKSHWKTQINLK